MARTLRITTSELERAVERGYRVAEAWRERYPNADNRWQAACVEIMMLPKVWRHVSTVMERRGHRVFYARPERITGYGLPGYIMRPWNGEPDESWPAKHSASVVWDGLRREVSDIAYWLYVAVQATQDAQINIAYVERQLADYCVVVVDDATRKAA